MTVTHPDTSVQETSQETPAPQPTNAEPYPGLGKVLVIIPTYNESENLTMILDRVRHAVPVAHVLVADDNSPDGTGEMADQRAAADPQIHVLHRSGKQGLGAAYLAGFAWGSERGYDVLVEMDADGSHAPEELPSLLDRLRDADVVIGSRWMPGGKIHNWPKNREFLSRGANTYVRLMIGMPVKDATAGFRAYRASVLQQMHLDNVASQGYCFQIDLTKRAVEAGLRVAEVPINFVEREQGVSKMSGNIMGEALINVTKWGVTRRINQLRRRKSTR